MPGSLMPNTYTMIGEIILKFLLDLLKITIFEINFTARIKKSIEFPKYFSTRFH